MSSQPSHFPDSLSKSQWSWMLIDIWQNHQNCNDIRQFLTTSPCCRVTRNSSPKFSRALSSQSFIPFSASNRQFSISYLCGFMIVRILHNWNRTSSIIPFPGFSSTEWRFEIHSCWRLNESSRSAQWCSTVSPDTTAYSALQKCLCVWIVSIWACVLWIKLLWAFS